MMELDILRSATEFPKDFQEFLNGLPMNIFSKQAQIIAQEITKLGETSININIILINVKKNTNFTQKKDDVILTIHDVTLANAILDRLLHHSHVINTNENSYRLKDKLKIDSEVSEPIQN